jgi:HSP20 family molecular chaperone IbpA
MRLLETGRVDPTPLTSHGFKFAEMSVSEEDDEVTVDMEKRSEEVFRVIDQPAEVDSSKVTATLKNRMLQVVLPKVAVGG